VTHNKILICLLLIKIIRNFKVIELPLKLVQLNLYLAKYVLLQNGTQLEGEKCIFQNLQNKDHPISHGQSAVERGFSTNKDLLQDNMAKSTLIAYRQVYDGLLRSCKDIASSSKLKDTEREESLDISNVTVSSKMLESCRQARLRYSNFLDDEEKKRVASAEQIKKISFEMKLIL